MKKILPLLPVLFIVFSSCKSMSYFTTPNDLRNLNGTLYLTNGKTVDGKLVINTNSFMSSPVKVFTDGDKKPMQFNLMDVQGYRLRNDYYALKEIRGGLNLSRQYSFMKRLTPDDSRISLYENMERVTSGTGNNTTTRYETQYYMQFPSEQGDAVWALSSNKFVPNFDEKMSRLVSDCPALARKIEAKQEGYFYAQVSLFREKRAEVLMNIIEEYNRCK